MQRAIWILFACLCATLPASAQESAGGGGSASGQTLGFEAKAAAAVTPLPFAPIESAAPPSPRAAPAACPRAVAIPGIMAVSPGQPVALYGVLDSVSGNQVTITTAGGTKTTLDAAPALKSGETTVLVPGQALSVLGSRGADGTIHADVIRRAKGVPAATPACNPPG